LISFPTHSRKTIAAVFAAVSLAACTHDAMAPVALPDTPENVQIRDNVVFTPSGAVFPVGEWKTMVHAPYLVPAEEANARAEIGMLNRAGGALRSLVGLTSSYSVLCHVNASVCLELPALVPGVIVTRWSDAQWNAATTASFAQFNMIYINDAASR
jgi:hypothetical protein